MPRLPRARAKRTDHAGVIPCVHNVKVPVTCYAIGEMVTVKIHFTEGRSWQPCHKQYQAGCPFCEAGNAPREHGYFAALLRTSEKGRATLTPVAMSVPNKSREQFPDSIFGKVIELRRTADHKLQATFVRTVIMPNGIKDLFAVEDVLDHHWFPADDTVNVPEIPVGQLDQIIKALGIADQDARTTRPKAMTAEDLLASATVEDLVAQAKLTAFPKRAEAAAEELRRRGIMPAIAEPMREKTIKLVPNGDGAAAVLVNAIDESCDELAELQNRVFKNIAERDAHTLPPLLEVLNVSDEFRQRLHDSQSAAARKAAETRRERAA